MFLSEFQMSYEVVEYPNGKVVYVLILHTMCRRRAVCIQQIRLLKASRYISGKLLRTSHIYQLLEYHYLQHIRGEKITAKFDKQVNNNITLVKRYSFTVLAIVHYKQKNRMNEKHCNLINGITAYSTLI